MCLNVKGLSDTFASNYMYSSVCEHTELAV